MAQGMSRKDPRRRMTIALDDAQFAVLRTRARGGSLADALRRILADRLDGLADLQRPVTGQRRLPLQLGKVERAKLAQITETWGWSRDYVVAQALAAAQGHAD